MDRCQPTRGSPGPAGGWRPPNKNPLVVDSTKVSVNPMMTAPAVTDSPPVPRAFQISQANDVGVVGVGWTVFALPEYLEAGRSISRQFAILGNQDMLSLDGLPDKQAVEGVTVRHAGQLMGTGGFIRIWRD